MKRSLRLNSKHLLATLLLAAASSCAQSDAAKVARAENNLHELFKQSKFSEIYRLTSPTLQADEREEDFVAKLREARQRTGEIVTLEKAEDVVNVTSQKSSADPPSSFSSTYLVKGKSRSCYEVNLWIIEGGEAKLLAYDCVFLSN